VGTLTEPVLCYVDDGWAYFTTQALDEQWGDDWDDAPYECNAETPYEDWRSEREGRPLKWTIVKVGFDGHLYEPHRYGEPYRSVQWINKGRHSWLETFDGSLRVKAGATLQEFREVVTASGGTVYEAVTK
jgi:hypothetical protein